MRVYVPSNDLSWVLSDTTPVQKTHVSIPRPLYSEVKRYIEDLHQGDRVLVRYLRDRGGPGKLRSYWESTVKRKREGIPVYGVEPESGERSAQVVHRNLLPWNNLPFEKNSKTTKKPRRKSRVSRSPALSTLESIPEVSSDGESEGILTLTPVVNDTNTNDTVAGPGTDPRSNPAMSGTNTTRNWATLWRGNDRVLRQQGSAETPCFYVRHVWNS